MMTIAKNEGVDVKYNVQDSLQVLENYVVNKLIDNYEYFHFVTKKKDTSTFTFIAKLDDSTISSTYNLPQSKPPYITLPYIFYS